MSDRRGDYPTFLAEQAGVGNKRFPDEARVPRNGRIKCGTESNGGFRNMTISGNVIEGCSARKSRSPAAA